MNKSLARFVTGTLAKDSTLRSLLERKKLSGLANRVSGYALLQRWRVCY